MKALSALLLSVLIYLHGLDANSESSSFLAKQEFLEPSEAAAKWGSRNFSAEAFKTGTAKTRASMAADLARGRHFSGRTIQEVRSSLGAYSGYFWNQTIPTYLISEGWNTNSDSWQLVFLLNEDQTISQVRIHKNCCPKEHKKP